MTTRGCIVCHARDGIKGKEHAFTKRWKAAEDASIVLLGMIRAGWKPEGLHRDLCFQHRRMTEEAAKTLAKEGRVGP